MVDRAQSTADPALAGNAISAFGINLFEAARADNRTGNLTVSPASVAIALAMLEPGTVDDAQTQLRDLLGITDPDAFHQSMNALEVNLETRTLDDPGDGDPGKMMIRIANAAYLQQGYPFEAAYLDAIGTNYGPVLNEVNFPPNPDAVAHEINRWVADATNQRITDLIADGAITRDTVLALVNALYLKASWLEPFPTVATAAADFETFDEGKVEVEMMQGPGSSTAQGDGWIGATKDYVGQLTAQFILPDDDRFEDVADNLPAVFEEYERNQTFGAELSLPKLETRSNLELNPALQSLGLTAPYSAGGLLGIAPDPNLFVEKVIHETFVAMDEEGAEAAAATAVLARALSRRPTPQQVVLDRPFIYRITDTTTGTTLFIGQITNPTAG
ncbi:MAG: serpin family protein [Acidimicrobiales bacterium]